MKKKNNLFIFFIIIFLIGTVYYLHKTTDLFTAFEPFTPTTEDTSLTSFVNKYYYDAVSSPYDCEEKSIVVFRSTFPLTQTNLPSSSDEIFVEGKSLLSTSSGSVSAYDCNRIGPLLFDLGILKIHSYSQSPGTRYYVCKNDADGSGYTYRYFTSGGSISNSLEHVEGTYEIFGEVQPIKDDGNYMCVNGNIVKQYCGDFGNEMVTSCGLGCEMITNKNIGNDVFVDAVKCVGEFKPNINVCSQSNNKLLYQTDQNGVLTYQTCGYLCNNGQCVSCKEGTSFCKDAKTIQICSDGIWINYANCEGIEYCSETGTSPDTSALCKSDFYDGEEKCSGNQPQIYSSLSKSFINKGEECTTSCVLNNGIASCSNQCTTQGNVCEYGVITKCNLLTTGNTKEQVAICLSGECEENKCSSDYELGKKYCVENTLYTAIESSDIASGGIALNKIRDCGISCVEQTQGDGFCSMLPSCTNRLGQSVCTDNKNIGVCSSNGESISGIQSCSSKLGNEDAYCQENQCKIPTNIPGTVFCDGTKIKQVQDDFSELMLFDCSLTKKEGLTGFCVDGQSQCNYCVQNNYYCNGKEIYQCKDPITLGKEIISYCEAGCTEDLKCDELSVEFVQSQSFLSTEDVITNMKLYGSETLNPINTKYNAYLDNSLKKTGVSGSSGEFSISLGRLSVGEYDLKIVFDDFSKEYTSKISISNDYKTKILGEQVKFLIPSEETKFIIESLDASGNAPSEIKLLEVPEGLTAQIKPTSVLGRWDLVVDGELGVYNIQIVPVESSTELESQYLSLEIRQPKLSIESNIPDSITSGTHQFDVKVKTQTNDGTTRYIDPSTLTIEVGRNATSKVQSTKLSEGKYTFGYDYIFSGTYSISVKAQKEGYDDVIFQKTLDVKKGTIDDDDEPEKSFKWLYYTAGALLALVLIGFIFKKKKR